MTTRRAPPLSAAASERTLRKPVPLPPKPPVSPSASTDQPIVDWVGGAAFGALLAILVGLSATPVVSGVVTGIVALLGGLFGLSDKLAPMSQAATRRLAAFGAAAVIVLPVALAARSHQWLAPSIKSQRAALTEMGFTEAAEMRAILSYVRFGVAPPSAGLATNTTVSQAASGVFYSDLTTTCGLLRTAEAPESRLDALDQGPTNAKTTARLIRRLPAAEQSAALAYAKLYLCQIHP